MRNYDVTVVDYPYTSYSFFIYILFSAIFLLCGGKNEQDMAGLDAEAWK